MNDRRQSVRQKSLLRGSVYFDGSPCAAECTVRDISETGARLKFAGIPAALTNALELQIPIKGQSHKCKVMWHAGDEVGVAFLVEGSTSNNTNALEERVWALENEIRSLREILKVMQENKSAAVKVA